MPGYAPRIHLGVSMFFGTLSYLSIRSLRSVSVCCWYRSRPPTSCYNLVHELKRCALSGPEGPRGNYRARPSGVAPPRSLLRANRRTMHEFHHKRERISAATRERIAMRRRQQLGAAILGLPLLAHAFTAAPSAIGGSEEELACYGGCAQKCMHVCASGLDTER